MSARQGRSTNNASDSWILFGVELLRTIEKSLSVLSWLRLRLRPLGLSAHVILVKKQEYKNKGRTPEGEIPGERERERETEREERERKRERESKQSERDSAVPHHGCVCVIV